MEYTTLQLCSAGVRLLFLFLLRNLRLVSLSFKTPSPYDPSRALVRYAAYTIQYSTPFYQFSIYGVPGGDKKVADTVQLAVIAQVAYVVPTKPPQRVLLLVSRSVCSKSRKSRIRSDSENRVTAARHALRTR